MTTPDDPSSSIHSPIHTFECIKPPSMREHSVLYLTNPIPANQGPKTWTFQLREGHLGGGPKASGRIGQLMKHFARDLNNDPERTHMAADMSKVK